MDPKRKKNGAEDDQILPCSFAYLQPIFEKKGVGKISQNNPLPELRKIF